MSNDEVAEGTVSTNHWLKLYHSLHCTLLGYSILWMFQERVRYKLKFDTTKSQDFVPLITLNASISAFQNLEKTALFILLFSFSPKIFKTKNKSKLPLLPVHA